MIRRANTGAVKTGAFGNLGYAAPDCFTATPKAATWATPAANTGAVILRAFGNPESGNLGYAAPSIPAP